MKRKYKRLLVALLLGIVVLIGLSLKGKRIYRYFFPRPEVPCCVKSPNADCCVRDTLSLEGEKLALQYLGFDAHRFIERSNSLLTSIAQTPIHLKCLPDWEPKTKGTLYDFEFDCGKGHRALNFSLSISLYWDANGMETDFKALQRDGKKDIGLTYANDDIWKTENRIVWLHVGCYYADFNHERLRQFVRETVEMQTITGQITCACGDFCD